MYTNCKHSVFLGPQELLWASRFRSDADDEGLYSPNFKRTYFKRTFGATRCSKVLHPGFGPGFGPGFHRGFDPGFGPGFGPGFDPGFL